MANFAESVRAAGTVLPINGQSFSLQTAAREDANFLLQTLDLTDQYILEPYVEHVPLTPGEILEEKGQRSSFVYFPTAGAVSLEAGTGEQQMQVALVGRESLIGSSVLLHGLPAYRAVVQFEGATWRAPADKLVRALENNIALRRQLLRGVNAFVNRLCLTALANGKGTIEQRLARWLLTAADRLDTDRLVITHDTLSQVLGVRRAGVTVALHTLEGKGALLARRRLVRLNRERLTAIAGPYRLQQV